MIALHIAPPLRPPLLLLFALAGCGGETLAAPAAAQLEIVQTHPHDSDAYTQGFLYHEGVFYESTGINGESSVRRVDIATGNVLARHDLEHRFFGEGLAAQDGRLYQLTWREKAGFVYDIATLQPVDTFAFESEGWGLTTDGTHLIQSDGTYLLRFLDPATFQVVRTLRITSEGLVVSALNELEWIQGEVWANIWEQDRIARIDPTTGNVVGWVSTDGLISWWDRRRGAEVANGIAYDPLTDRLWLTGKRWPRVFEVKRPE